MSAAPLLAVDVAGVLLGGGIIVLVVCTLAMSVTLPTVSWGFARLGRRRSTSAPAIGHPPVQATHRRVVTGRPVDYRPSVPAAIPLPAGPGPSVDGRQRAASANAPAPDRHIGLRPDGRVLSEVDEAVATIEHELDTDPERLARLMMDWIRSDRR